MKSAGRLPRYHLVIDFPTFSAIVASKRLSERRFVVCIGGYRLRGADVRCWNTSYTCLQPLTNTDGDGVNG